MKRDLDLIRNILLAVEADQKNNLDLYELSDKLQVDPDVLYYHLELLQDAKFIIVRGGVVAFTPETRKHDPYKIERLTFDGCDYLDAIRNTTVWNRVKKKLKLIGGTTALSVVKEVAVATATQMLNSGG